MVELRAKSSLDSKGYNQGVDKMEKKTKGFAKSLGSVKGALAGAFAIGGILRFGRSLTKTGSDISDIALQSRLTTDEFQAFEIAAIRAGVAPDQIRTALSKLNITLGQAKRGMKTYVDLFKEIGVSESQLKTLKTADAFEILAKSLTNAEEGTSEYAAGMEILGTRSGAKMLEILDQIANVGLQGMIDKAKEAGQVIDADMIDKLDKLEDRMLIFGRQIKVDALSGLDKLIRGIQAGSARIGATFAPGDITKQQREDIVAEQVFGKTGGTDDAKAARAAKAAKMENDAIRGEQQKLIDQKKKDAMEYLKWQSDQELRLLEKQIDDEKKAAAEKIKYNEKVQKAKEEVEGIDPTVGGVSAADRLARIGGQMGGMISPEARIAERALKVQEEMVDIMMKLPPDIAGELTLLGTLI